MADPTAMTGGNALAASLGRILPTARSEAILEAMAAD